MAAANCLSPARGYVLDKDGEERITIKSSSLTIHQGVSIGFHDVVLDLSN